MSSLIILLMALVLFIILAIILLYIWMKKNYIINHLSEDYDIDIDEIDDEKDSVIDVVHILINNEDVIFESNNYFLIEGEEITLLYNDKYVDGTVLISNKSELLSNLDYYPPKLELYKEGELKKENLDKDIEAMPKKKTIDVNNNKKKYYRYRNNRNNHSNKKTV